MRQLIEEYRFIGLEELNVKGMMVCEARFAHRLAKSIGDVGVQRRLIWLPGGKSQPMVSIIEDLFCLWYGHGSHAIASSPVAMPCL